MKRFTISAAGPYSFMKLIMEKLECLEVLHYSDPETFRRILMGLSTKQVERLDSSLTELLSTIEADTIPTEDQPNDL